MGHGQTQCVQGDAMIGQPPLRAIFDVTQQRVARQSELGTDLVAPAGHRPDLHQGPTAPLLNHIVTQQAFPGSGKDLLFGSCHTS